MKKAVLIIVAVLLAAACICASRWFSDNRLGNFREERHLYVGPDTTADEVLADLLPYTRRQRSLKRVFSAKQVAAYIHPGHYLVKEGSTSVYVARMLNNGWQTPVKLVLSGTMRLKGDIAHKISVQMMVDSAAVRRALDDEGMLREFGFTPQDVFLLFIPDTYEMYWTDGVEKILSRQKKEWDSFWNDENRARAARQGLTPRQAGIVASIVQSESNFEPEYPRIAGVYLNRLRKGMRLQADPTVAFCYDYSLDRIYKNHLKVDSPYNTYRYAGLPPGPICVPSRAALLSVLDADTAGGNLYFCADPSLDGTHRFARTYSQHLANARAFQKELNGRNSKL